MTGMVAQTGRMRTCSRRRLGANDSRTRVREGLYNRRSELASVQVGANAHGYTTDTIGNRLTATENATMLTYTANALNLYMSIASATRIGDRCLTPVANPVEPVYDADGNIGEAYGPSPNPFAFGFSTKYHDRERGLIAYQRRFYVPSHGRWLNRDPIEEDGGVIFMDSVGMIQCLKSMVTDCMNLH